MQADTLESPSPHDAERAALRASLVATGALAVVAVVWGWFAGSQVMLLDGVYATIGMILTWLSLGASRMAQVPANARYPYGRRRWCRWRLHCRASRCSGH